MKTLLSAIAISLVLILQLVPPGAFAAPQAAGTPVIAPPENLKKNFNLHYTGQYCSACHSATPTAGSGDPKLKFNGDLEQLCGGCHDSTEKNYLHPVGVVPSPAKRAQKPADFPLVDGKLACTTCHDLYLQCQADPAVNPGRKKNPKTSLRGAPFKQRTDFCFNCHDRQNYEMQNPHDQKDDSGKLYAEKCLYCHKVKPDEQKDHFKDIQVLNNIEDICQGCHVITGNHSGNYNHLIAPSEKFQKRFTEMEKKFNIILPLAANGKMSCMTCHNPHEKGIIPEDSPAATGADSKYRHRLPGRLCQECHGF